MLVAIVLWPFNVVKLETICYTYASNITLQFMPIYVCTKPGGSPLMDYLLQRTYLCIHLHLFRIEVIQSWYVGHFHQIFDMSSFFKESWLISSSKLLAGHFSTLHWPDYSFSWPLLSPYSTLVVVVTLTFDGCKWFLVFPWMILWCCRWLSILPNMFYDCFHVF